MSGQAPALKLFKVTALAEAVSWAALLVAMFLKWVTQTTEVGVQAVGPIHGTFFLLYCASVLWCWQSLRWSVADVARGIASAFPPFLTVWFERRMVCAAAGDQASTA